MFEDPATVQILVMGAVVVAAAFLFTYLAGLASAH